MCANYIPSRREQLEQHFGVATPDSEYKAETYPGYMAPFIRKPQAKAERGDRSAALGMFGMVPHWAKDLKLARQTYNARTETVASKPTFRSAFKHGQFCIIPAASIFEPCYESGKAERWEIAVAEGAPMGIAGIWEHRQEGPNGLPLLSFSMLTVNADGHALMQRFHKPDDEKRMVIVLAPEQYDDWLHCPVEEAPDFFQRYPAEKLSAHAAPRTVKTVAKDLFEDDPAA
jgi:putative SOS response-associated peptidase YedK